jgi:hypothetical protein
MENQGQRNQIRPHDIHTKERQMSPNPHKQHRHPPERTSKIPRHYSRQQAHLETSSTNET